MGEKEIEGGLPAKVGVESEELSDWIPDEEKRLLDLITSLIVDIVLEEKG